VRFSGFGRVMLSVARMAVRCVSVVRSLLMVAIFIMFDSFTMVARCMIVMLGRLCVVLGGMFRHITPFKKELWLHSPFEDMCGRIVAGRSGLVWGV